MTFTVFLQEFWKLCYKRETWIPSGRFLPLVMWGWVLTSWFVPVCIDRHWWLYAFEIAQKRLWVLDSMYSGEHNNERLKIHAYAVSICQPISSLISLVYENVSLLTCCCFPGRIIEDMAKVSMPAYEHTENGLPRFYPSIPKQHNGCDCGVFVIKFMQFWSLDKPLQLWDKVKLNML
ncbi:hypothetical protein Ahy_A03g014527 [Arachis hypogaea]|uniref:Ubiquitin-like protease family profile domain-containing protein n=1 Tax=Arachis hypogaea TaxID=3818 RepID=A0A445DY12_ARAHY|nr:hypothetical protein Ahy_A03g014527 [Arachis hypogaea]